jgi:hypothetical protein
MTANIEDLAQNEIMYKKDLALLYTLLFCIQQGDENENLQIQSNRIRNLWP